MARHQQKDEEAGGDGLGVIETRKKSWKDANGSIVSKRPARSNASNATKRQVVEGGTQQSPAGPIGQESHASRNDEPISPPGSILNSDYIAYLSNQHLDLDGGQDVTEQVPLPDMFTFLANSTWDTQITLPDDAHLNAPFQDMFSADTGE